MATIFASVDEYIAQQNTEKAARLNAVRAAVKAAVPAAVESIKYGMPSYKTARNFFHFAAYSGFISLYPGGRTAHEFAAQLRIFYVGDKGTVRIMDVQELPLELIAQMAAHSATLAQQK